MKKEEEELVIELLKKAARHWPESLWIFAAEGCLHVMRKQDGKPVMTRNGGGFDQNFIVETIGIEADGGDW